MSSPIHLRLKLEGALVAFVKSRIGARSHLKSLKESIVPGHTNAAPSIPYLVIHVPAAPPHGDMPKEAGIKSAQVVVQLKTEANDEQRRKADERLEELETLLMEPLDNAEPYSDTNKPFGRLLAFLNKPATGADPRKAEHRGFHAYDFYPAEDSVSADGATWTDQLAFTCVCQPMDSH